MLKNLKNISPLAVEIISFLNNIILNNKIERIIVCGSRAFGDFEQYSDLDLAIDAPNITKYEWLKLKEFVTYELRTVVRVSLVHYSSNPQKLKERIIITRKIIYARHRKLKDSLSNLRKAIDKLNSALQIPNDRELVERTVKRFEVVVELLWKTLIRALKYEGIRIQPDSPREAMKEGFAIGWLHNETKWQDLVDKRNTSSHEYFEPRIHRRLL